MRLSPECSALSQALHCPPRESLKPCSHASFIFPSLPPVGPRGSERGSAQGFSGPCPQLLQQLRRPPPPVELVSAFQIITALEEDGTAQKMQLGYRLQQIAAAVENKVTDL